MFGGVKETQCSHCDHLQVCANKEQFLAAQKAVDEVHVQVGNSVGKMALSNFDWIRPVKLECIHFSARKPTQRDISIAKQLYEESAARGEVLMGGQHEAP